MAKNKALQAAEEIIAKALRKGTTALDLSCFYLANDSKKLTELPDSLGQLTQLRNLNLSENQLAALPQSLVRLTRLQSLNLSENKLNALPESLGHLAQLRSLDLSGNELTVLPESLDELTQLQSLNLSHNQLTALPESLGHLTQLQSLNLSHNQLTALPESLRHLTQLRSLYLSGNELSVLPESLGHLTQLKILRVSNNKLASLPRALMQLTQLETLRLAYNKLTALPDSLGQLTQLRELDVCENQLKELPKSFVNFRELQILNLFNNRFDELPDWIGQLNSLRNIGLGGNSISNLPDTLGQCKELTSLDLGDYGGGIPIGQIPEWIRGLPKLTELAANECRIKTIPDWVGELENLTTLYFAQNELRDVPASVDRLESLEMLLLDDNPLNPELAAAKEDGLDAVKRYLRAKAEAQVVLNEAKLILVGEGEVGKSCLLGALREDPWEDGKPTTHGIEIKPVKLTDPATGTKITLNGWDFGGQRVYRPTHQLFFTAPAVYLVVWKPREGPQQGFVKDWIKLIKHREPDARIIVVATHGGPKERQPDIDRQEIWDLFGKETVVDFFLVQSKPDETTGERHGIAELREAIARVAASLPEMGRTFSQHWQEARTTLRGLLSLKAVLPRLDSLVNDGKKARSRLQQLGENRLTLERAISELSDLILDEPRTREELSKARVAYLPLDRVFAICREHQVEEEDARLLLRICRRVGDLIHFEHDPALRDIVILKPDWLATAMSFVLDDEHTRDAGHGLVSFERLGQLWNDPDKPADDRYPSELHPIFVRLMERFDLCYRVAEPGKTDTDGTSLIAQLVPDVRPDPVPGWAASPAAGDGEQVQVCRIVEMAKNQSATAEGIFYQLIVRLHKYSLGRANHVESVHWQRGLVLQDNYGARAFLEHIANDIRITVRSPYPERFLAALTYEIKWLVESFWEGLRCQVTVPCLAPQPNGKPCIGLFEVGKLLENKRRNRPEQPCPVCNEWQNIEQLLHNAPASRPAPLAILLSELATVQYELAKVRQQLLAMRGEAMERFDGLDLDTQRILSRVDDGFAGLMQSLNDEAREGPRLFSFEPVDPGFFDRPKWISEKFRLTLWCEHSRLPLPKLNRQDNKVGVYDLNIPREWFVKAAPFLKVLTGTLSLVLPVAASATKLVMDETAYQGIEKQLELGQKSLDSVLKGGEKAGAWLSKSDAPDLEGGEVIRAQGAVLRQLQAWIKEKDPGFGGLIRVQNKRQEFLWVHPQYEGEY